MTPLARAGRGTQSSKSQTPQSHPSFLLFRLASAAVRISVSRSLATELPGVQFSPLIDVMSNEDGSALKVRMWEAGSKAVAAEVQLML